MNKSLIIALAIIGILSFTNPSKEQYVLWATNKIIEQSNDNTIGTLVSVFAPAMIEGSTLVTNDIFFSTFITKFDNKEYVTLGILNKFITLHDGIKDTHKNKAKEIPSTVSVAQPTQ